MIFRHAFLLSALQCVCLVFALSVSDAFAVTGTNGQSAGPKSTVTSKAAAAAKKNAAPAGDASGKTAAPVSQKSMRVVYVEGGPLLDSVDTLRSMVKSLQDMGMLENVGAEMYAHTTAESLWGWLSQNARGKLVFVADGFYGGQRDMTRRQQNKQDLQKRIAERKDVDLILAFGTPAGLDMSQGMEPVPVLVSSTTDPVGAGIIASVKDSGRDNVHAAVESTSYIEQLALFKSIFQFKSLGICYENSPEARSIIAYDEVRTAAATLDFVLVEGIITDFSTDEEKNVDLRVACHERLATRVDAVYLTMGAGTGRHRYKSLLAPLLGARIPTFSQNGEKDVEAGALLSFSSISPVELGAFEADVIRQVYEGKSPRAIPQLCHVNTDLALNLRNAAEIGWHISPAILSAVDKVYSRIQNITQ